jgi:hypothetical protein
VTPLRSITALTYALFLVEREMQQTCGAVEGPYNEVKHNRLATIRRDLEDLLLYVVGIK